MFAVLPVLPVRLVKKALKSRQKKGICVEGKTRIGGVMQYVSVRGEDENAPLVVFLHGGPALPTRGTDEKFMRLAEKRFVCVCWDQRGSGRSEGEGEDGRTLLRDLDEVTDYALKITGKRKAWIVGHCWGSVIGLRYAAEHPEKTAGYAGVCQFVSGRRSYAAIKTTALEAAAIKGNFDDAAEISRRFNGLLKAKNVRETDLSDWTRLHALYEKYRGYAKKKSNASIVVRALLCPDFSAGDFCYLLSWADQKNCMKEHEKLMNECIFGVDFLAEPPVLCVPCAFIEAGADAVTDSGTALRLMNAIDAPRKKVYLVKNAGHNVTFDNPAGLIAALESEIIGKES
ncbi:MAG: alpha/beta hydrolase [Candidatus Neoclostridium sp.]